MLQYFKTQQKIISSMHIDFEIMTYISHAAMASNSDTRSTENSTGDVDISFVLLYCLCHIWTINNIVMNTNLYVFSELNVLAFFSVISIL